MKRLVGTAVLVFLFPPALVMSWVFISGLVCRSFWALLMGIVNDAS